MRRRKETEGVINSDVTAVSYTHLDVYKRQMHGIVTDSSEPLYGRADEIIKLQPMTAYWLQQSLGCSPTEAVEEFSVWGGVPRYWELRKERPDFGTALKEIILDHHSILHDEPIRLFLDDMRESVQAYSILSVIGSGCNRLSEIAGRLGKQMCIRERM